MSHIVVDARGLLPRRDGITTYLEEVVPPVIAGLGDHRVTLLVSPAMRRAVDDWGAEVVETDARPMWPTQNLTVPPLLRRLRPDLYFYPAHDPPVAGIPCPTVLAVHDLTPLVLRPYFEDLDWLRRAYLHAVVQVGIRRAARILVPSEATRRVVVDLFGDRVATKTRACWYGAPRTLREVGEPTHLLYLGTDRPHKNLHRLVEAYARASRDVPGIAPLVIAGGLRDEAELRQQLAGLGITGRVEVTGHVSDERVEDLLRHARALLMPSLAEGFGLPIVDAMANGVPVLTSNLSSCAEVAGEAALLVDPSDVADIATGIARISTDDALRAGLAACGRERAQAFSWSTTAAVTLEEVRGALEDRS